MADCMHLVYTSLDVNECAIAKGGCEHECINTEGSFYCDCREGHMLESNNSTCEGNKNLKGLCMYCTDLADALPDKSTIFSCSSRIHKNIVS